MSEETDEKEPTAGSKPKRTRQTIKENDVWIYRKSETGQQKKVGSFPESVIGEPRNTNLPGFIQKMFGTGSFRAEIRNGKGHFEDTLDFSITDDAPAVEATQTRRIPVIEPDFEEEEQDDFDYPSNNGADFQMLLIQQENERLKAELARQESARQSSQSEQMQFFQMMLAQQEQARAREDAAFNRALKLSQMMQPQQQQSQSKDPLQMLSEIIAVNRGVRELSDELSPPAQPESSGSLLGDAAQLISSLKDIAPSLLPMFLGAGRQPMPTTPTARAATTQTNAQPTPNKTNLSELFAQGNTEQNGGNEK